MPVASGAGVRERPICFKERQGRASPRTWGEVEAKILDRHGKGRKMFGVQDPTCLPRSGLQLMREGQEKPIHVGYRQFGYQGDGVGVGVGLHP